MLSEETVLYERRVKAVETGPEYPGSREIPVAGLHERYVERGFTLSGFSGCSTMLRHENELVFIISSTISPNPDIISRICDCHLNS
jgi:hypothetical protein